MKKMIYAFSIVLFIGIIMAGVSIIQGNFGYAARKSKTYFSKNVDELEIGNTFTFKVSGVNNDGRTVLWSSSDPNIAKVNRRGKVTARKRGKVMITARMIRDGKKLSQKLTIVEKLKDQEEENRENQKSDITVKNLSTQTKKIKTLAWHDIGFLDWKEMDEFSYSLFQKVFSLKEKNPVLSPLSAYLALALVKDGARGNTKAQFDAMLGDHMLSTRIHQLTESLSQIAGSTKLSIADSIWLDDLFLADDTWLSNMVNYYNAEIFQTDLSTDTARLEMNHWVSKKTKKMIPTMFEKNLKEDVCLVLMNALYLKAKWENAFDASLTNTQEFTNENGKKTETEFMNQYRSYYRYFNKKDVEGIILPYDDACLSMIAIRPNGKKTARELSQSLTAKKISQYIDSAENTYINLHLPKFTMEYSKNLNESLIEMGLEDAFSSTKADFTGLGTAAKGNGKLYISEVLQKVKIQVDEKGTEAAATTEISMGNGAGMPPKQEPKELTFDQPFLYLVVDTKTPFGETPVPLFMGLVTELD